MKTVIPVRWCESRMASRDGHLGRRVAVWLVFVVLLGVCRLGRCDNCPGCGKVDPLCGPKCLKAICARLGVEADLDELAVLSGFEKEAGTSMAGLQSAATAKGLEALGVKMGLDELSALGLPAIAYLWSNHFSVVGRTKDGSLTIADPPSGPRTISREDLGDLYSGFALLVAKDSAHFPQARPTGPDLRLSEYLLDLGAVEQDCFVEKTLMFRNAGNEDLALSKIEGSADYLYGFCGPEAIRPGGEAEMVVLVDASRVSGVQHAVLRIHSNDPISPVVQLQVWVEIVPARLMYSPRVVDLGTVRKGERASRSITIPRSKVRDIQVLEVSSDNPYVTTAVTYNANSGGHVVSLSVSPEVPIGEMKGSATVYTNHPKEPRVDIPFAGTVKGDVDVVPGILFFGVVKPGSEAQRTIRISTASGKRLRVVDVENLLGCLTVTLVPGSEGDAYTVTATLRRGAPLGYIKGAMVLHTDDAGYPEIRIPVYGLVQARITSSVEGG